MWLLLAHYKYAGNSFNPFLDTLILPERSVTRFYKKIIFMCTCMYNVILPVWQIFHCTKGMRMANSHPVASAYCC